MGHQLLSLISETRQKNWMDIIESIDIRHGSKPAWKIIRLNCDETEDRSQAKISPNQLASCLVPNGKSDKQKLQPQSKRRSLNKRIISKPFKRSELDNAMNELINGKACGVDGLFNEQLLHSGPHSKDWLLRFYSDCLI